ncbi:hypothetical protein EJB05_06692, partial [Eragrostis curvula]
MKNVQSPSIARELVKLAIRLAPAPEDIFLMYEMSELKKSVASGDEGTRDSSDTFQIISCKTRNSLAAVFLQMVESSLAELDWGLGYDAPTTDEDHPVDERMQRLDLEEALYSRSALVVHVLSSFAHMSLKFLKLSAKFYKLLTRMAKSQIAPKGYAQHIPGSKFQKLAEVVTCRMLTAPLYAFVSSDQENQQTSKKGTLAKIRRESNVSNPAKQTHKGESFEACQAQCGKSFQIKAKEKSGEQPQEEDCAPSCAASSEMS